MIGRKGKIILAVIVIGFSVGGLIAFAWSFPPFGQAIGLPQYADPFPITWQATNISHSVQTDGVIVGSVFYGLSILSSGVGETENYQFDSSYQIFAVSMSSGSVLWESSPINLASNFGVSLGDPSSGSPQIYSQSGILLFMVAGHSISIDDQNSTSQDISEFFLPINGSDGRAGQLYAQSLDDPEEPSSFAFGSGNSIFYGYVSTANRSSLTLIVNSLAFQDFVNSSSIHENWERNITLPSFMTGIGNGLDLVVPTTQYLLIVFGEGPGYAYSLNTGTGSVLWQGIPPDNPFGQYGNAGVYFFQSTNSTMYYISQTQAPRLLGVALANGELVENWSLPVSVFIRNPNSLASPGYFVSYAGGDYLITISRTDYTEFNITTGSEIWNLNLSSIIGNLGDEAALSSPVIFQNDMGLLGSHMACFFCSGNFLDTFAVVKLNTGNVLWTHVSDINSYGPNFSILASNGNDLVYTWYGKLVCANISKLR